MSPRPYGPTSLLRIPHLRSLPRVAGLLALAAVLLLLVACPQYHYLAKDTYLARSPYGHDLFQLTIYEGLYAETSGKDKVNGKDVDMVQAAVEEMNDAIAKGERFDDVVTLSPDPAKYAVGDVSPSVLRSEIKDMEKEDGRGRKRAPAEYTFDRYVLDHLTVHFGCFFVNSQTGRLGAYHISRLTGVRTFLNRANAAFSEMVANQDLLAEFGKAGEDDSTHAEMRAFKARIPRTFALWQDLTTRKAAQCIVLDGSAVEIFVPGAPEEAEQLRAEFWRYVPPLLFDDVKSTSTWSPKAIEMARFPFGLSFRADGARLTLGDPTQKVNCFVNSQSLEANTTATLAYKDNLTTTVMALPTYRGRLDPAHIVEEFRASPARLFAHLPPSPAWEDRQAPAREEKHAPTWEEQHARVPAKR